MPDGEGSGPKELPKQEAVSVQWERQPLPPEVQRNVRSRLSDRIEGHYNRSSDELAYLIAETSDPRMKASLEKASKELDRVRDCAMFSLFLVLDEPVAIRQLEGMFDPKTFKGEQWLDRFLKESGLDYGRLDKKDDD